MNNCENKINLTKFQLQKIQNAYKNKKGVSIRLSKESLTGSYKILLNQRQNNKLEKARKNKVGVTLELNQNQLKQNHEGGFLPLLLGGIGALSALASGASAIANSVINKKAKDKELAEQARHNKAIEGKGIKKISSKR